MYTNQIHRVINKILQKDIFNDLKYSLSKEEQHPNPKNQNAQRSLSQNLHFQR